MLCKTHRLATLRYDIQGQKGQILNLRLLCIRLLYNAHCIANLWWNMSVSQLNTKIVIFLEKSPDWPTLNYIELFLKYIKAAFC